MPEAARGSPGQDALYVGVVRRVALALVALLALLVLNAAAPRARAHGGRPQTQRLLFAPDDPDRMVIAATFGLLTSDDAGATWSWTCQESMPDGVPGVVQPAVLATGDRLLVAGTFGLVRGARAGCGWERDASLEGHYVADVVRDPSGALLAITGDSSSAENGVWESVDEGASFHQIGAPLPLRVLTERVRVAPSDARRIYVSGQRFVEGTTDVSGVLLRSDDRGASWTELPVPLVEGDRLVRVVEVDPSDPGLVWLVVQGAEHDRVLQASSGGTSVRELLAVTADPMPYQRPYAFARAPDGTVWFGNTREGLVRIAPDGAVTVVDALLGASCAVVHGDQLYLCGDGVDDGFALARTPLDTYAPEPIVRFGEIARRTCDTIVDCLCAAWWDDFQVETIPDGGVSTPLDGGTCVAPDAGLDAGPSRMDAGARADGGTAPPPPDTGCACRASGSTRSAVPSGSAGPWTLAAVALAFFLRRRGLR